MYERFEQRTQAGWCLAQPLKLRRIPRTALVVGVTRGGVPLASEISKILRLPMDILVVRKICCPGNTELSIGAVAASGEFVLDKDVIHYLGLSMTHVEELVANEKDIATERECFYRAGRQPEPWTGRTVLLIDDGMARGMTMLAAVKEARKRGAANVVVCVPVSSQQALEEVRSVADEVVCLRTPEPFSEVDLWYWDFAPMTDSGIRETLQGQNEPKTEAATMTAA